MSSKCPKWALTSGCSESSNALATPPFANTKATRDHQCIRYNTFLSWQSHILYHLSEAMPEPQRGGGGRSISNRGPGQTQNRFIFGQAGNAGIAGAALEAATQYFANQVLNIKLSKLNTNCHYLQSTPLTSYWHYRQQTTNLVIFTYSLYFRATPTTGSSLATLLLTMVLLGLLVDLLDLPSSTVL